MWKAKLDYTEEPHSIAMWLCHGKGQLSIRCPCRHWSTFHRIPAPSLHHFLSVSPPWLSPQTVGCGKASSTLLSPNSWPTHSLSTTRKACLHNSVRGSSSWSPDKRNGDSESVICPWFCYLKIAGLWLEPIHLCVFNRGRAGKYGVSQAEDTSRESHLSLPPTPNQAILGEEAWQISSPL